LTVVGPLQIKKVYPLTSVRFFAAAVVLFHHSFRTFLPTFAATEFHHGSGGVIHIFSFSFQVSVSFFFFLSGYVLALVYLPEGRGVDARSFWAARFARLYPLYLLMLVLDTPELLMEKIRRYGVKIGVVKTAEIAAANAALLQSWSSYHLGRINPPTWSLCAEVFFYACFPVIGVWLWKLHGRGLWSTALALFFGGQALVWLARLHHVRLGFVLLLPPLHLSTFALGILFARWNWLRQQERLGAGVPVWQASLVLGLSVAGLLLSVPLSPLFHVPAPYNDGMLAPIFAGVIWGVSTTTRLSRWLCAGWLVALGNASYALYLIHYSILRLFVYLHWVTKVDYAVYVAVCIGLSLLSFRYFETPVRLWLLEWFRMRSIKISRMKKDAEAVMSVR
jgi:peptidoglycan/LPS O-acetylase OafA/YrhL